MKPVYQKIIDVGRGDCFSACLASLLEMPLEDVPNFRALETDNPNGDNMTKLACGWLHRHFNLSLITIYNGLELKTGADIRVTNAFPGTPCIACVKSPNFENANHSVCGEIDEQGMNFVLTHDPNPNGKPISSRPLFLQFLVPMKPIQFI
ncbi:MAG TPA: hypothetical protein VNI84_18225 [Pyrinomonadaceae bacterium]|nr:hypothetical protein [Pyrinomonadaceae bacterium]